jgi:hypothetical protein
VRAGVRVLFRAEGQTAVVAYPLCAKDAGRKEVSAAPWAREAWRAGHVGRKGQSETKRSQNGKHDVVSVALWPQVPHHQPRRYRRASETDREGAPEPDASPGSQVARIGLACHTATISRPP